MCESTTSKIKENCPCLDGNFYYRIIQNTYLGGTPSRGEVSLPTCTICGRHWLEIFYDPQIHDNRYARFRGLIKAEDIASIKQGDVLQNALAYLESLDWYYVDGTDWSDRGFKTPFKKHGKILLWS